MRPHASPFSAPPPTQVVTHGKAVLGYVVLGPVGLLLLADSLRVAGLLPGGHEIKTVTQSRWYRINLQVRLPAFGGGREGRCWGAEGMAGVGGWVGGWRAQSAVVPHQPAGAAALDGWWWWGGG
jgi:hypothetical protein